ncbi:MAG TPA: prepilin-type N-terminal cleavage/methylation domain-containing protein [Longimicrobium sp.]|uniref:PilW family protein n=1 Tax=Longimicrobium sp. TaxID=2029185 RepID=UPI002ED87857
MPYKLSRSPRAGFTLAELMVALVISGLLMTVVFQMLSGQSRMVAVQSGKEEAQQNVRGALEVISSELRGAMPGALLNAQDRSLTFMQPRAWGVVCGVAGSTVTALFPITGGVDSWNVAEASGVLINQAATPADPAVWLPNPLAPAGRAQIQQVQVLAGGPNVGACAAMQAQGNVQAVQIATSQPLTGAQGATVVTYTLTQYDFAQVGGRWWLRRNSGVSGGTFNQQPLAGPLEANGFTLSYFTAGNPPVAIAAPGTNAAALASVRMVQVRVASNSTQTVNSRVQRDEGTVTVLLRN